MVIATNSKIVRYLPLKLKDFDGDAYTAKLAYMRYLMVSLKMTVGLMAIQGDLGAGKTLFAWMIAWYRKELFGIPCTCDHPPRKAFGEYHLFDYDNYLKEIEKVDKMANQGTEWTDTNDLLLYKHTIWLDEAYKYFPRRRPMSSINIALGDVIKQMRHFKSFMILAAPNINELDATIVDSRIDIEVKAIKHRRKEHTYIYEIYNRRELIQHYLEVYGPNYYPLFNTTNPIGKRMKLQKKDYSF